MCSNIHDVLFIRADSLPLGLILSCARLSFPLGLLSVCLCSCLCMVVCFGLSLSLCLSSLPQDPSVFVVLLALSLFPILSTCICLSIFLVFCLHLSLCRSPMCLLGVVQSPHILLLFIALPFLSAI